MNAPPTNGAAPPVMRATPAQTEAFDQVEAAPPLEPRQFSNAKKRGGFTWCERRALRVIEQAFDAAGNLSNALALYVTITCLASESQAATGSEKFETTIRTIAARAGLSYRRTHEYLARFERLGLLTIHRNRLGGGKELGPSSYELTSVCRALGDGMPNPSRCGAQGFGTDRNHRAVPRIQKRILNESGRILLNEFAPVAHASVAARSKQADLVFEAIGAVCGYDLAKLTDSARGGLNKAAKEIRSACPGLDDAAIAKDVRVRAQRYLARGWGENSPLALAKHWPGLDGKRVERRENATRTAPKLALPPAPRASGVPNRCTAFADAMKSSNDRGLQTAIISA